MNNYGYYGRITAVEGKKDELLSILLKAATLLQENGECLHYVVGVSENDDIWVSELWKDEAAHDNSLSPENIGIQSII